MYPHLCPLLATLCINTPNSSYSRVFTVVFWPLLCDSLSFMFFLVQFLIKILKSICLFFFLLPISASLCLSAYLFFVVYRFGDKLVGFFFVLF